MQRLLFAILISVSSVLQAEILILTGISTSGKTTASRVFAEKVEGKTTILGFDLLSIGEEGDKFQEFLLTHPKYVKLLHEIGAGENVNLFKERERDKLNQEAKEWIETKLEDLVEVDGVAYKNQRLVEQTKEALHRSEHILLDVLEVRSLRELFQKENLQLKVVFLYVPITKYLERIRFRNKRALELLRRGEFSAENDLRDPFDMITQYAKFFTVTKDCTRRMIENVDSGQVFSEAAFDAIDLFKEVASVYHALDKEEEAQSAEREVAQIERTKDRVIVEEQAKLNPLGLKRGYLTLKTEVKADLYLNTHQYTPKEVGERMVDLAKKQ